MGGGWPEGKANAGGKSNRCAVGAAGRAVMTCLQTLTPCLHKPGATAPRGIPRAMSRPALAGYPPSKQAGPIVACRRQTAGPHLVRLHKQARELRAQQRAALQLVSQDKGQAALQAAVHDHRHVRKRRQHRLCSASVEGQERVRVGWHGRVRAGVAAAAACACTHGGGMHTAPAAGGGIRGTAVPDPNSHPTSCLPAAPHLLLPPPAPRPECAPKAAAACTCRRPPPTCSGLVRQQPPRAARLQR